MQVSRDSVTEKVRSVFSGPDKDYAPEYLRDLRDNWRQSNEAQSKNLLLIVFFAALFELLARAAISKASIGPFEISDLSLVRKSIPVIIAYLYYDLGILAVWHALFEHAHKELMRILHAQTESNDLDILLRPRLHAFAETDLLKKHSSRFVRALNTSLMILFLFGVIVFEAYAYYVQFVKFKSLDPFTLITLLIVVVLMIAAIRILTID